MASSQIPLNCCICPKKPKFSDASHLLTHVGSKGHLSNYYKAKVRSNQDQDARDLVDAYDNWYIQWNVEQLMSDRMNTKGRKKPRKKAEASNPKQPRKIKPKPAKNDKPPPDELIGETGMEDTFHETDAQACPLQSPALSYDFPQVHRPKMHLWSTEDPCSFKAAPIEYSSPPPPSYFNITPQAQQVAPIAPMVVLGQDGKKDTDQSEATRLKGICWPGMDVFDAASPATRRKRNQKKHVSVMEQLEANSLDIEPTENIFTPLGSLFRSRLITGQASSSPLKYDDQMHYDTSTRAPLVDKDPNRMEHSTGDQCIRQLLPNVGLPDNVVASTERKKPKGRKRKLDVFKDRQDGLGDHSGMKHLTAGFDVLPEPKVTDKRVVGYPGANDLSTGGPTPEYLAFTQVPAFFAAFPYYPAYNRSDARGMDFSAYFAHPSSTMYAPVWNNGNGNHTVLESDDKTEPANSEA